MAKEYVSEITLFIKELKERNPKLDAAQRDGRALLWDKEPADLTRDAELKQSKVAMQAYPYQTKS
jgi:Protein of unknown function (DUF3460)